MSVVENRHLEQAKTSKRKKMLASIVASENALANNLRWAHITTSEKKLSFEDYKKAQKLYDPKGPGSRTNRPMCCARLLAARQGRTARRLRHLLTGTPVSIDIAEAQAEAGDPAAVKFVQAYQQHLAKARKEHHG
jgi:hypothetical protein